MVAGATPYYTIDELKSIFKISADRTIAEHFGSAIRVKQQQNVVPRKYLVDLLGFEPTEPFLTRVEVMHELGVTCPQINKMITKKLLPVFQLKDRRGCTRLFLRRDVMLIKRTLIEYYNSVALLDDHNHKLRNFLTRIIEYDYKGKKHVCKTSRDYEIFQKHILNNDSNETIAEQMELTTERLRQCVCQLSERLDAFLSSIDEEMQITEKMRAENAELSLKVQEYEKYIAKVKSSGKQVPVLDINAIEIIKNLKNISIDKMGMSVRLGGRIKNVLKEFDVEKRPELHKNGKWIRENTTVYEARYCNLFCLLKLPIKRLVNVAGFGTKCYNELMYVLKRYGLKPNNTYCSLEINAMNVLLLIEDQSNFLEGIKNCV